MRFRWKLLILLLVIAMVPMVMMRFFGSRSVQSLGDTWITQARETLILHAEDRLRLVVDGYASVISRAREKIEIALSAQADAVERALAGQGGKPRPVYFSEDFTRDPPNVPGLVPAPEGLQIRKKNAAAPLDVTFDEQVFVVARGVRRTDVDRDLQRMSGLPASYRRFNRLLREAVSWHYTTLSNGLHSAYPGHGGGTPGEMDPRDQRWYRHVLEHPGRLWTDAYLDPETRQIVIAAVMPVYRPGGEMAGVTAIVVPVSHFLSRRMLVGDLPPNTRSFLGFLESRPETGDPGIHIVSQEEYSDVAGRNWRDTLAEIWLTSDKPAEMKAVIGDFQAGVSNTRRMTTGGCDCIWAYGPIHQYGFLILTTPYTEILAPAQRLEARLQQTIEDLLYMTRYWLVGSLVLVILLALAFSRTVTRPLQALAEGARRLGEGQLDARVEIHSRDEFGEMGRVFNETVSKLIDHSRMSQSLRLAMEVQQNLLPRETPALEGFDIAAAMVYCDETGGDYYDFITLPETGGRRLGLVVGDVSDHGIPSALLMATARALLRQRAAMPGNMGEIVSDVNRLLCRDVEDSGRFMTMFFAKIEAGERSLQWVRAGHDPALLFEAGRDEFVELRGEGVALGISDAVDFQENRQRLESDDVIIIGTDGIWEARDADGRRFGRRRMREIIRESRSRSARAIVDAVIDELNRFRNPDEKEDDVTLMIVKVTPQGAAATGTDGAGS